MKLEDLSHLDFQDVGSWPVPVKLVAVILVIGAILVAGYKMDIEGLRAKIEQEKSREVELLASLDTKQKKAANLEALKTQMKEMQQSFGDMLRQLPNKTEVAGLLVDISQTGLAAGLEFKLFKPGKEVPSEFYSELPIQISVVGTYHQFGEFISGIASLPRIVTTHDVNISSSTGKGKQQGEGMLEMKATVKTYRALDEEELEQEEKAKKKAKKGGKRR